MGLEETAGSKRPAREALVLVVESDAVIRDAVSECVEQAGLQALEVRDGVSAWEVFQARRPGAIVAGTETPGLGGMELFRRVRDRGGTFLVLHSQDPAPDEIVAAIRDGVDDFVALPADAGRLTSLLRGWNVLGDRSLVDEEVIGSGVQMRTAKERIGALASVSVPVVVRGEAGSGRSHVVRVLHAADIRHAGPLREVNPGQTFPRVDASGAYFLREVTELPAREQGRWAREIGVTARDAQVPRVYASTTENIAALVREGKFDEGLWMKLRRFYIDLPPLRDRRADIPALSAHLGERIASRLGRRAVCMTAPATRLLSEQVWPGNVRELADVIERLIAFSPDGRVTKAKVEATLTDAPEGVASSRRARIESERQELRHHISDAGGNLAEVGRRLGLSRGAVIYRAEKYGLLPRRVRREGVDGGRASSKGS